MFLVYKVLFFLNFPLFLYFFWILYSCIISLEFLMLVLFCFWVFNFFSLLSDFLVLAFFPLNFLFLIYFPWIFFPSFIFIFLQIFIFASFFLNFSFLLYFPGIFCSCIIMLNFFFLLHFSSLFYSCFVSKLMLLLLEVKKVAIFQIRFQLSSKSNVIHAANLSSDSQISGYILSSTRNFLCDVVKLLFPPSSRWMLESCGEKGKAIVDDL